MRFFLLDRVTSWTPGVRAEGVKNVALSEDYMRDHFPRVPTMPGVLILESMAQLAGILLEDAVLARDGKKVKAVLSIVERAKFRRLVKPGDQLRLVAEGLDLRESSGRARTRAFVGDDVAASADLIFAWFERSDAHLDEKRREVVDTWMRGLAPA
jgi:3-hydroxymyristoyl/3-hydroxydecanoyl-(acyl carrier protein) dehydratase